MISILWKSGVYPVYEIEMLTTKPGRSIIASRIKQTVNED
jgi:hypothetical protein